MTTPPVLLHTAARRYLMEQHARWTARYAEIAGPSSARYTDHERDTFPRYNVLEAVLTEVERLEPERWHSLMEARARLAEAGRVAESPFTRPPQGPVEAHAMTEEREAFRRYVAELPEGQLVLVEPLPYRRVLQLEEEHALRERLRILWGVGSGYWYPLTASSRPDVLALQAPYFRRAVPAEQLHALLAGRGVQQVWELREFGPSYRLELSLLDPVYDGAEGVWGDETGEWLLYASHEQSITVGGAWLIAAVQELWSAWETHVWSSPFF